MRPIGNTLLNHLIARLPRAAGRRLVALGEVRELPFGAGLGTVGGCYTHAYFPLEGFISLISTLEGHAPVEIGLIGNEGMLGATLALGVFEVPATAVVQGGGRALRISSARLCSELIGSPSLRKALHRYVYVLVAQQSQLIACAHFHPLQARMARWLLMAHDRAGADTFHVTHADLAKLLGVTRSSVSIAAWQLQLAGLIRYTRGMVHVLDRSALEQASCACYAMLGAAYARQFVSVASPCA